MFFFGSTILTAAETGAVRLWNFAAYSTKGTPKTAAFTVFNIASDPVLFGWHGEHSRRDESESGYDRGELHGEFLDRIPVW
jgi:hypothetical protein